MKKENAGSGALETNSWSMAFRLPEGDNIEGRPIHLTLTVQVYPSTGKLSTWKGWISMEQLAELAWTLGDEYQLSRTDETDRGG